MEVHEHSGSGIPQCGTADELGVQKDHHTLPSVGAASLAYGSDELDVFDLELQKEFADASLQQSFHDDNVSEVVDSSFSHSLACPESEGDVLDDPIASVFLNTEMRSVAEDLKVSEMTRDPRFSRRLVKELAAVVRRHCQRPSVGSFSTSTPSVEESEEIDGATANPIVRGSSIPAPPFPSQVSGESTAFANLLTERGFCSDGRKEFEEDLYLVWNVLGEVFQGVQVTPETGHTQCSPPSHQCSGPRESPMTVSLLEQHERFMGAVGRGSRGVFLNGSTAGAPCAPMKCNGRNSIDTEVSDSLSRLQVFSSPSAGPGTDPLTTTTYSSTSSNRGGDGAVGAAAAGGPVDGWRDNTRSGAVPGGGVRVVDPKGKHCLLTAVQGAGEMDESVSDFRRRPVNPYIGCTHGSFTTPGQAPQTEMPAEMMMMMGSMNPPMNPLYISNPSVDLLQYQKWYSGSACSQSRMRTIPAGTNHELLTDSLLGSGGDEHNRPHCSSDTGGTHRMATILSLPETQLEGDQEERAGFTHRGQGRVMPDGGFFCYHAALGSTFPMSNSSSSYAVGSGSCGGGSGGGMTCGEEELSAVASTCSHVVCPRPVKPATFKHWAGTRGGEGSAWIPSGSQEEGGGTLKGGGGRGRGPRSLTGKNICPSNHSAFSECSTVGESRSGYSMEQTSKNFGKRMSTTKRVSEALHTGATRHAGCIGS